MCIEYLSIIFSFQSGNIDESHQHYDMLEHLNRLSENHNNRNSTDFREYQEKLNELFSLLNLFINKESA